MNYLTLVNKENLIKDNYFKYLELIDYHDVLNSPIKVEKETLESYLQLKSFLEIYLKLIITYFGAKIRKNFERGLSKKQNICQNGKK